MTPEHIKKHFRGPKTKAPGVHIWGREFPRFYWFQKAKVWPKVGYCLVYNDLDRQFELLQIERASVRHKLRFVAGFQASPDLLDAFRPASRPRRLPALPPCRWE